MAQSERGGLDFRRAKPADPSARARARARAILKKTRRPFSHEGKSRTKIRKFVAQMCPMDKSGWGYFSFFGRLGHTHGTPGGVGWGIMMMIIMMMIIMMIITRWTASRLV